VGTKTRKRYSYEHGGDGLKKKQAWGGAPTCTRRSKCDVKTVGRYLEKHEKTPLRKTLRQNGLEFRQRTTEKGRW